MRSILFENNPNPMFIVDNATNNILDVNNAALKGYGYSYDEFLSMSILDIRPEEDVPELLEVLRKKRNERVRDYGVWRHLTKGGNEIYVHVNSQLIDYDGTPARLVSANDITELINAEKELKKAYQQLDFHVNNSPLAFIEWDENFRVRRWSEKTAEIFGWTREEVIGQDTISLKFIFEEDASFVKPKMAALINGDITSFRMQNRNYTKDGRVIYCEWYNSSLFDESGTLISILSQIRDITASKEAEMALVREKDFVDNIINSLPGTFYLFDKTGKILRWNKNFVDVTGYSDEEIKHMKPLDYFEGKDKEKISRGITEVFEKGRATIEAGLRKKDGTQVPYLFNGFRFRRDNEEYLLGTGMDISENKQTLQELESAKNLLEQTYKSLNEAVLIIDPINLTIIECNPAVERIFGYKMNELVGKSPDILHVDKVSREYFSRLVINSLKKGRMFRSDYRLKRKDGKIIFTEHTVTPLNENGRWQDGMVTVIRDITEQKLRDQELRIKDSAIESALNAIVLYDMKGYVTYVNPSFLTMWGFESKNEVYDRDPRSFWQNEDELLSITGELKSRGKWSGKLYGRRKNNEIFPVRISANIVKNETGSPICMMASIADISDREKTRRELEESQRMLATLMENLPGMAYRCKNDKDWTMLFVSGGCNDLTGYSARELIGNFQISYAGIIVPEDRKMVKDEVELAIRQNRAFQLNYRIKTRNGSIKWVWEKGLLVSKKNGGILEGFITDITERVKITEELKKQAELFSRIFEDSPVGIAMVDENNSILMINKGFQDIFGYKPEEVNGKNLDSLIVPESMRTDAVRFVMDKDDRYVKKETIRLSKGNKELSVLVYGVPVFIEGRRIADFGIYVDITNRKMAEQKVLQSLKEKEVLLAEIHHRVKNNLAIISGLLELQSSTMANEEIKSFLQESQTRIKSIAMIHEKLYHSETLSNIEFDEYIVSLSKSIEKLYKNVNKQINFVTNAEKVLLNINQAIPCALLLNEILVNAYKHAFVEQDTGNIQVELKSDSDYVILKVKDDGIGLPKNFDIGKSKSLGMTLITTLSKQLSAELEMKSDSGLKTMVTFKKE